LSYLTLNNIVTLKSGLEVTQNHSTDTIRKLAYGFLFVVYSNYVAVSLGVCEIYFSRRAGCPAALHVAKSENWVIFCCFMCITTGISE